MNALLTKLSEQQALLAEQKIALALSETASPNHDQDDSVTEPVPLTPATEKFGDIPVVACSENEDTAQVKVEKMERLKKELDEAKDRIARQEQELSQTRVIKHTIDQVQADTPSIDTVKLDSVDRTITSLQDAFGASRPVFSQGNLEDARSDASEILSAAATQNRGGNIWGNPNASAYSGHSSSPSIWCQNSSRSWVNRPVPSPLSPIMIPSQHQIRNYSGPSSPISASNNRYFSDFSQYHPGNGNRRSNTQNSRNGPMFGQGRAGGWDSYGSNNEGSSVMGISPASYQPIGMFQAPMGYQPRPIGTPLSPMAAEFTATSPVSPWNSTVSEAKIYGLALN